MQDHKRLAVIKFSDYAAAKRAYESPRVIFDNRFVKCYWFKTTTLDDAPASGAETSKPPSGHHQQQEDTEMSISPEEFEKKQAEAQKAYEEKQRKKAEADKERAELEKKQKAMAEERQALMAKLAAKAGKAAATSASPAPAASSTSGTNIGAGSPASTQPDEKAKVTEALRQKLARLEAEAQQLGVSSEDPSSTPYGGYGGPRGGYQPRGRGGFRGAARGRGGYAPRGGYWGGGSVARLDNRPKTVMVRALDEQTDLADETTGEMLRAFLYGIGSFSSITPPAEPTSGDSKQKTTTVAFHERYVAEMFLAAPTHTGGSIPGVGRVELTWVANAPVLPTTPASGSAAVAKLDVDMDSSRANGSSSGPGHAQEQNEDDWDVADEDVDRWADVQ